MKIKRIAEINNEIINKTNTNEPLSTSAKKLVKLERIDKNYQSLVVNRREFAKLNEKLSPA